MDTPMVLLASVDFHVRREKRLEFTRAAETFIATLRRAAGCIECRLLSDCEARGSYVVFSQWQSADALNVFLQSSDFRALLGTRILLRDHPRIQIDEVARRTRLEGGMTSP